MHHHGTDGRWHMSYGIKLVLSLIYEGYILTCISNQIPLYSTRCNNLFMPNYVNDLTMQQILACLQSPIAFSFVCLFWVPVCLFAYACHDVCPDDLTMKDWCHTNNILQVNSWCSLVVQDVSHTHDVVDDVSRPQSMSNFEIVISPSMFQPERPAKVQNIGNAHGYLAGIFNIPYCFL